ncbi:hypothetical protein D6C83_04991, partial [Aureobasidium pullulans]
MGHKNFKPMLLDRFWCKIGLCGIGGSSANTGAEHSGDERQNDDEEDEGNGVMTSQLRHFIAQPYIHPPMLLPAPFASADRKFHI